MNELVLPIFALVVSVVSLVIVSILSFRNRDAWLVRAKLEYLEKLLRERDRGDK